MALVLVTLAARVSNCRIPGLASGSCKNLENALLVIHIRLCMTLTLNCAQIKCPHATLSEKDYFLGCAELDFVSRHDLNKPMKQYYAMQVNQQS